jgi:hypothetical protein
MPDYALGGKLGRRSALYIAGMLLDCSRQHSLQRWGEFGSGFQTVVVIKRGDLDRGLRLLGTSPNEIANSRFRSLIAQIELAEALAHAGRIADGLALVEAGIEQSDGAWGTPELLRLKGELLLTARSSCGPRRLAPRPPGLEGTRSPSTAGQGVFDHKTRRASTARTTGPDKFENDACRRRGGHSDFRFRV